MGYETRLTFQRGATIWRINVCSTRSSQMVDKTDWSWCIKRLVYGWNVN